MTNVIQKYRNQIIAGLVLVLVIYVVLLLVLDNSGQFSQGMTTQLQRFPVGLLGMCALMQGFAGLYRFYEWHYYLGVIDARRRISLKDSAIIFTTSFTFVVSPGKLGELLKSVLLRIRTDVPVARSAPVVIAERVVDGLAVVVMLLLTLIFAGDRVDLGEYEAASKTIVFTSAALVGIGLIVIQIAPLAYFCLRIVGRMPLIGRLQAPLTEFYESSREVFKLRHVLPTSVLGVGVYLSTSTGFLVLLYGFGLDITWTLVLQVVFIVGVVSAVGALRFVPNGAGISEASTLVMLNALVAPSHPELTPAVAATVALLEGFFHKWFRVLVGLIVALIYRNRLFSAELEEALVELEAERKLHTPAPAEG
jgi:uncharacterized protein (TIRG00374 family)